MAVCNKIHNAFKLDGVHYTYHNLKVFALEISNSEIEFKKSIGQFLTAWLDNSNTVSATTSGSTGSPKQMQLKKEAMWQSALATGQYFKLQASQKALHCLPSNYIAGKMMLVRAMALGLDIDLVAPTSTPLKNTTKSYDFCAMVPLQLQNSLSKIDTIKTLIVGGAQVSKLLQDQLKNISTSVYETYGMTETLSHIAVRPLHKDNTKSSFNLLPHVSIHKDNRNCLVINAPKIHPNPIVTNDIVKLNTKTSFEFLGRYDTVINSGGLKFIPEQIEQKLQGTVDFRFFIASVPDKVLGERIVIVVEAEMNTVNKSWFKVLSTYEVPKQIYYVAQFVETKTGKVNRRATLELIDSMHRS